MNTKLLNHILMEVDTGNSKLVFSGCLGQGYPLPSMHLEKVPHMY